MKRLASSYIVSIEPERFHTQKRFHWTIAAARSPDRLLSWGHAPSLELADDVVKDELEKLAAGHSLGGLVKCQQRRVRGGRGYERSHT